MTTKRTRKRTPRSLDILLGNVDQNAVNMEACKSMGIDVYENPYHYTAYWTGDALCPITVYSQVPGTECDTTTSILIFERPLVVLQADAGAPMENMKEVIQLYRDVCSEHGPRVLCTNRLDFLARLSLTKDRFWQYRSRFDPVELIAPEKVREMLRTELKALYDRVKRIHKS